MPFLHRPFPPAARRTACMGPRAGHAPRLAAALVGLIGLLGLLGLIGLLGLPLQGLAAGDRTTGSTPAGSSATPAGSTTTTATGLVFQPMKAGSGASPKATDTVRVHYRGTLMDGTEFDSSYKRGQPAEFPLNKVIPCWTEGLQRMSVGATARLTCPPSIAYGSRGAGGVIPPNATLKFEVELIAINPAR